jgi:hypothetical protein
MALRLFGVFVALQTFALLARADRWAVLTGIDRGTWPFVLLLWARDLALAVSAGLAAAWLAKRAQALPEPAPLSRRAFLAAAAAIVCVGTFLRWVLPVDLPPGVWFDVPWQARTLLIDPTGAPWIGGTPFMDDPAAAGNHELVSNLYLRSLSGLFRVFGRAETGFLAVSAVPGTLTLLGALWLGTELFGRRAGLLGAGLTALCVWPLVFSRWSFTGSALVALALPAAAAAVAALRRRSTSLAAVAGLTTGFSLHTHPSAWPVAAGLGAFSVFATRDRGTRRLAVVAWACAALAFAPFAKGYLDHPECFGGRARDVGASSRVAGDWGPGSDVAGAWQIPATLASNAIEYSGLLLFTTDPNPRDGIPGRPTVTPLLALASLVGFALVLARGGTGASALGLLVLGSLAGGVLANPGGAPNGIRACVVVIPALLAGGWLLARLAAAAGGLLRESAGAALVLALVLAAETVPFLTRWNENPYVARSFCVPETLAARLVRGLGTRRVVLAPGTFRDRFVFDALSGPVDATTPIRIASVRKPAELGLSPGEAVWYVARRADHAALAALSLKCARGIAPSDVAPDVLVASVRRRAP